MSDWGSGYVTDITYTTGWYRQQSPSVLAIACLLGGVESPLPASGDPVSFLELGCGHGFTALLLAASNPAWRVTAVDFNPAHIATARAWAAEAGLENVAFIEADLATLAESALAAAIPMADVVSLHGVWSWVPPSVQAGIVRLLRDKVQPGGLVHVSYNALPGWGGALGMQRVLRGVGRQLAARSDRQAEEGLRFIRELAATDALQLRRSPVVQTLVERLPDLPGMYLAHEYMNSAWAPCFVTDVAAALADARLEWVATANLIENFPELTLSEQQRALVRRIDDPVLRELVKDHCIERLLRHDVFVRGARRIAPRQRDAALLDLWLTLNIRPQDMPLEAEMPAGKAELNPLFYQPIVQALAAGPRRVGDLLALPDVQGSRSNPAELVGILAGSELAEPVLRPAAAPSRAAQRFNSVAARRLLQSEPVQRPVAAASERLGGGAPTSVLELVVLDQVAAGAGSLDELVAFFSATGAVTDEAKLRTVLRSCLDTQLPRLRAAGVI
jgi:SAM-dependent methyltransferase